MSKASQTSQKVSSKGVFRAVLGKEVQHGLRDRSLLILVILVPLLLAGITTLAFGQLDRGESVHLGVVNHDTGNLSQILVGQVLPSLESGNKPLISTTTYQDDAAAEAATKNGTVAATIIIPSGFTAGVAAGDPPALTLVTGGDTSIGVPVARAILTGYTAQISTVALAIQVATSGPGAAPASATVNSAAADLRDPVTIDDVTAGQRSLSAAGYFAPSMLILALFFSGQIAARGLVAERERRTLTRILLSSTPFWKVIAAKAAVAFGAAIASAVLMFGVFSLTGTVFGSWPVVAVLVLFAAAAMISISSLVVLIARTEEQAGSLSTVMIFVLAIVGGNFVPLSQTPQILERLALFTPNGWTTRAFADLSVGASDPWGVVAPALWVLLGFTVAAGTPVFVLSRRMARSSVV